MTFSRVFKEAQECKEGKCKVNKKNIKTIFKPDDGFIDKSLKNSLFLKQEQPKMCDCIIVCKNEKVIIVEILCGTLTNKELKDKSKQLENCYRVAKAIGVSIDKIYLSYKKLNNSNLKKKLINHKILNKALIYTNKELIEVNC